MELFDLIDELDLDEEDLTVFLNLETNSLAITTPEEGKMLFQMDLTKELNLSGLYEMLEARENIIIDENKEEKEEKKNNTLNVDKTNNEIDNPKTGIYFPYFIISILLFISIMFYIKIKNKNIFYKI